MHIELLYFEGCPHWRTAAERLDRVLAGRNLTAGRVRVESADEAEALRFRGSPTILVDGHDPFVRGDEPFAFSCRVYATPSGLAGSPTIEQLEAALDQPRRQRP